jgi:rfaE bifunctional protein nucleotidyltransferase chain/domain
MVKETGELINRAVGRVTERLDTGMGALLGEELFTLRAPNLEYSLLAAARRLDIPLTVHVAIGTDIVHMHGSADGAALGLATFNDFRLFAAVVAELSGGVYVNMGSAVLLPEVFLKAFTVAQNLGAALHDFVTVNMDMINHYRCGENVVHRPPQVGGKGYTILGRHEIMIPLLAQAVVDRMEKEEEHSPTVQVAANGPSKVTDWETLLELRERWRAAGKRVVWTNGCFDLLHVGHLQSLRAARAFGDYLVVGVNGDESVRKLKGSARPIVPAKERAELVAGLDCVDRVIIFEELTPEAALFRLRPDIHCKGAEYAPPHGKPVAEAALVRSYGGKVEFLPMVSGLSTTNLIERVRCQFSMGNHS